MVYECDVDGESVYVSFCLPAVTNYGYEWESGTVHTATKYKAGTGRDITATVGLHIGLRGINITLKGTVRLFGNSVISFVLSR